MAKRAISGGTIENKGCQFLASIANVIGDKVNVSGGTVYQVDNWNGGKIYI